jgi:beta-lactamase class A
LPGSRSRPLRPIGWPSTLLLAAACTASDPADPPADEAAAQAAPVAGEQAPPVPAWSPHTLEATLEAIAAEAGGDVGVAAIHLESGRRASRNGDVRLPMASVYKLPIALEVLRQVDLGTLSLEDSITIRPDEFVGGAGRLTASARGRPVTATVGRLFAFMLTESDNTASDALLRAIGGPGAARRRLAELGIEGVDVSRYEAEIFAEARIRGGATAAGDSARGGDPVDARDTATAEGLAELLAVVFEGAGLGAGSHALLLERLAATTMGPGRIKGALPPETAVAHKTGTFGTVVNDVGIVTLPDGNHVAIAVLTRSAGAGLAQRERAIARMARAVYDAFAAR